MEKAGAFLLLFTLCILNHNTIVRKQKQFARLIHFSLLDQIIGNYWHSANCQFPNLLTALLMDNAHFLFSNIL